MTTVRLNEKIRRKILHRLLDHAFGGERGTIAALEERLGQSVYADLYDAETLARMEALPEGFFERRCHVFVAFGGQRDSVPVSGPVAHCHSGFDPARSYAASDPRSRLHADIYRRKGELKEREDKARREAMAALGSASTLRQLIEAWPEVAEFAGDVVAPEPATKAIAVSVAVLNKQLRLGKGARK